MKHTKTFLITALLAFVLAACGTTDSTNGQKGAEVGEGFPTVTVGETSNVNLPPELRNPTGALAVRSIYFDYDKFDVRSDSREVLAAHAKVLVNNPRLKMLVQGNTDDRGSSEYNLALGQKRAEAVKKSLALFGAREEQVEAISLGKEKPRADGSDEAAWSENRRADILYSGEF